MVELENITVLRNGRSLFEDFSFRILPGEHWVIQGANGSGKTLLLQILAGAVHPTRGNVRHSFIDAGNWDDRYRQRLDKIHLIPTQWLYESLPGANGLFYQQRYYSMDDTKLPTVRDLFGENAEKLKSLRFSERFDINGLLDLELTRLSNGQLKKVAILRQLVKSTPALLLLDYPFDGLDADSQRDLAAFLDEICQRFAIQIVVVDHGHALPKIINRRLVLRNFKVDRIEEVDETHSEIRSIPADYPPRAAEVTSNQRPVIEMQNVSIRYGDNAIISKLNWRINEGERWALTGRNGSGKTTLFSLIYADHPMAYSQKVFLFGRRRGTGESIWDIKKRISYFGPEQIHFLDRPWLSGRAYISSQPHKKGEHLEQLVAFFKIAHYVDQPMKFLSSGQLQLLLLINMFLEHKELLLLDEPFQFLDPENHRRVTDYLNHYLRENITLVLITHDEKDVIRWTQNRKHL
jgi:molybdate transport system ATP-binding protein